jgi:hypothetical protein
MSKVEYLVIHYLWKSSIPKAGANKNTKKVRFYITDLSVFIN